MAYCRKCGCQMEDDSQFCSKCGTPVNEAVGGSTSVEPPKGEKVKKKNIVPLILIVIGIGIICVLVLLFSGKSEENEEELGVASTEESLPESSVIASLEPEMSVEKEPEEESSAVTVNGENIKAFYGQWVNDEGITLKIGTDIWTEETDTYFLLEEYDSDGYVSNVVSCTINDAEINWDSYHVQYEDWEGSYDLVLEFAQEGIYVEGQNGSWPERTLFTMRGAKEAEGDAATAYNEVTDICVNDQYSDGTYTYLLVNKLSEWDPTWIVRVDGDISDSYIDYYVSESELTFCPDWYIKGYPVCMLNLSEVALVDSDTYWSSMGGDFEEENEYVDNTTEQGQGTDLEVLTPPEDFTKDYDTYFYDEATGLWVFANTTTNMRPFKMTGIDVLDWKPGKISFVGRIQNTDSVEHRVVRLGVAVCGEGGKVLHSDSGWATYYPYGYTIIQEEERDLMYITGLAEDGTMPISSTGRLEIPAGAEAVFTENSLNYVRIDISKIQETIKYIYVTLESFQ